VVAGGPDEQRASDDERNDGRFHRNAIANEAATPTSSECEERID
jgi:hypothetical protein